MNGIRSYIIHMQRFSGRCYESGLKDYQKNIQY
jgi:hypothetical protein